ncbi:hypothetical protein WAI453_011323 [Rhynchosporium graminicola]
MLYAQNAKVWIAAHSEEKATKIMDQIKAIHPSSRGALLYLQLELNDLTTIKASAEKLLTQENSLHVLWNNAGVMRPPQGSKTKQRYELEIGMNNAAPHLFTKLLTPLLKQSPRSHLLEPFAWFGKAGNIYQGTEYSRRYSQDGILSVSVDPGFLKTDLYHNLPRWQAPFMNLLLHDPIYGAYTELYAGLSTDIEMSSNGNFVEPWGKLTPARKDTVLGSKSREEGGSGIATDFWEWCGKQIAEFV